MSLPPGTMSEAPQLSVCVCVEWGREGGGGSLSFQAAGPAVEAGNGTLAAWQLTN